MQKELAQYLNLLIGVRRIHTFGIFYSISLIKKTSFPCSACGQKLIFIEFTPGPKVSENALFYEEALKIFKDNVN